MNIIKKIIYWIISSIFIFTLMILAVYVFWELYAKKYIDNKINNEVGQIKTDVKQTRNNSDLIIDMLNIDKNES